MDQTWYRFVNELVCEMWENETNIVKLRNLLELAYETYMYTLLHSYVTCVYTRLKHLNLFILISEKIIRNCQFLRK